jgi:YegS/Rv2252/BmrU family lipid kinase
MVAVVAHRDKELGGGLPELRQRLAAGGVIEPMWFEVSKSAQAPKCVRKAIKAGADLIVVWGGDGMVQQCIATAAGSGVAIAIMPAGTANLLATYLGVPTDVEQAVAIGLHGARRLLDVGVINGERFAVMAGAGFDARMMNGVDGAEKARFGRIAYVRSGIQALRAGRRHMKIKVDGRVWFDGSATCVLFGNIGTVAGGLKVFPEASPDDGMLEIGVATAKGVIGWVRVLSRVFSRHPNRSPLIEMTRGRTASVQFDHPLRFELDGGARTKTNRLKVSVEPAAIWICVPEPETT